jgi:uncharacterized protein YdhG (YjbR/CyaY superfamily)
MQSKAKDVAAYIGEAPEDRKAVLTRLRKLCVAELKGCKEAMEYGMPCYTRDGVIQVAFASQKQYISLYGIPAKAQEEHAEALAGAGKGKGCIRFKKVEKIDFEAVRAMVAARGALLKTAD